MRILARDRKEITKSHTELKSTTYTKFRAGRSDAAEAILAE